MNFALISVLIISFVSFVSTTNPCQNDYTLCAPDGASDREVPDLSPALGRLYLELLDLVSVRGQSGTVRARRFEHVNLQTPQSTQSLCCALTSQCLLVRSFNIPICWDRFTTNFGLPDMSYGTLVTGEYTTNRGDQVNLITGDFNKTNGQTGNIYAENPTEEIASSTLIMPTPFTSQGVGTAIPGSELGAIPTGSFMNVTVSSTITSVSFIMSAVSSSTESMLNQNATMSSGSASIGGHASSSFLWHTSRPTIVPPIDNNGPYSAIGQWRAIFAAVVTAMALLMLHT